jgi:hypothetical protein
VQLAFDKDEGAENALQGLACVWRIANHAAFSIPGGARQIVELEVIDDRFSAGLTAAIDADGGTQLREMSTRIQHDGRIGSIVVQITVIGHVT